MNFPPDRLPAAACTLPPALAAERFECSHPHTGRISCYAALESGGPPLLLVHSINAAAAASEVRPLFDHYRATRSVFAVDLPGYGFSERSDRAYTPGLLAALRGPGQCWGGALFRGLTRPGVVRFFLRKTWGRPEIDETMWAYAVRTAQEPGAEFAPLHFLSGGLFSADVLTLYESLVMPVRMGHGVRGDFTDYRGKGLFDARANWRFSVFQTGALPHFEVPSDFHANYDHFLRAAGR